MHLYVKSAIKSSVVTSGVSCDLRGAGWNKDVVFSKENVIEVLEHSDDGSLSSVYEHSVFGTIRDMKSLTIPSYDNSNNNNNTKQDKKDILVFVSDSGYLSFVGWSAEMDRLICISQLWVYTKVFRTFRACLSLTQRLIIVTAMQDVIGIFLVLPNISKDSSLLVSSPLSFCDMESRVYLSRRGFRHYIICYNLQRLNHICRDGSNNNKVKVYEFNLAERVVKILYTAVFVSLPLFIIPIPHYPSHFFVVHENMNLSLMNSHSNSILCTKSIAEINNSSNVTELVHKWCWLDKMLFLGCDKGTIIQVCIEPPEIENDSMQDDYTFDFVQVAKKTPVSAMIPLAHQLIALAGEMGDGEIVFATETTRRVGVHPVVSLHSRSVLYNWSPIIDFQVADYDEENQDQIFAVSGTGEHGSLRIIRNGLAVEVLKTTSKDYNVSGMWLVDNYVVMAFAESTGVYKVSGMSRDFDDFSIGSGLDLNVSTFFAANIFNNLILQVTNGSIRLCTPSSNQDTRGTFESHNLDPNSVVSCAGARNDTIIVGISKPNRLLVFKVLPSTNGPYEIKLLHNVEQEKECSYIEMPVPETCARNFPDALNHIVFVATHRPSLDVYYLGSSNESFTKIMSVNLGESEIPASICCNNLGTPSLYLLVGTREGAVLRWELSLRGSECTLHNLSTRRVGILPVNLVGEQDFGVLALSNHPWLVSSSRNRPTFTSISFPMVSHATRLISPTPGEQSFLFISDQSMNVITFPRNRKLNVSKFDLHATPQRILYINSLKTLVIATRDVKKEEAMVDESDENESEIRVINPIDGKSLFSEPVGPGRVLCLKELKINGQIFILVGTGYELFNNVYTRGILFLFSVHKDSRKLTRVWQKNLNGYVQSAVQYLDFLIVGVSDSIVLFQLGQDLSITKLHVAKTRYPITSLSLGAARMLVGSMRDGLMFYHFDQEQRSLQFKLGDARSRITSDCLLINDETAFGIDRLGNLHVLVYGSETERHYGYSAIEAECSFSLRETALKIHTTSSLVKLIQIKMTKERYQAEITHPKPLIILCPTMLGSVIAVTQLQDKTIYNQLAALSEKMAVHSITAPLLGNSHSRYRSELQSSKNVIDGDLIGQFVDLSPQVQESICAEVEWKGPPLNPHQICRIIEKIDQTLF